MTKKLACVLSLALAWLPLTAHALGLGEIKLNSSLNDKLNADIQVIGATSDELDSLAVQLASLKQFAQQGLDHPEVLNQLQFVVVRNPDGTAYVHITSSQAVREPFLDFLVDANWNNGELIREYTVLLNPPSFQNANAPAPQPSAPPAAASAPVVAAVPVPTPAPAPATVVAAAPAPAVTTAVAPPVAAPTESAQAAPQPQSVVAAAPPPTTSPPAASAVSPTPAPVQRALGANYGPIHRGETLSSIAKQLRPEGVSLNQAMLAIYQQNPEVFMHNINRMKAGYILRLPSMSDMQAISVADANAEVRTQMDTWRASRGQTPTSTTTAVAENNPPPLQIVAPSSAAENNGQVPGAEKNGNGTAPGAAPAAPPATQTQTTPPPLPTSSQAPLAVNSNTLSSVQQQASQQTPTPVLPTPSTAPKISPPPVKKPQPVAESGGFLDAILNIYVLIAVVAVGLIVLFGVMLQKRRQKGKSGGAFGGATPRIKGADWLKQEQVGDDVTQAASSTTRTKAKQAKQAKQDEKTQFMEPPTQVAATADDGDKTQLMTSTSHIDTMVANAGGGGAAKLDVSDPLAEADFHMAYGLYDQAADVLRKALRNDPNRREVAVKLLEVFFTAGDRNSFVAEAKKLREAMGAAPTKEWESVAIMGRQVAPDEPLFSASGSSGTSAAVDIALEGGGTDTVVSDMDALAGAFAGVDLGQAPAPAPAPAPVAANDALEFSLPDLEPTPAAAPAPPPAPAAAPAPGGLEFDLGDLNFEPTPSVKKAEEKKAEETKPAAVADEPTMASDFGTDSQVEFDKALNDLATFVNTNVPAQPEAAAAEPSLEGLSLSAEAPAAAVTEEDTSGGGSSLSEVGTKLDLARAYIDMGDPEGAKSILQEVVAEGDAQQKKDAQELLKHVS